MTNIPTELLRTLVAVVDLRSFTKAAQSLGVTQPAVSAQVKRLQGLLGADLLDKSAPGVSLTSSGELVVNYARRLLSINDQILDIAGPRLAAKTIRIGTTGDVTAAGAAFGLKCARADRPDLHFQLYSAKVDHLLRDLREGEADLAIWASTTGPSQDTRHCWAEPLVWVCAPSTAVDAEAPVPLVSYGEECLLGRVAMNTLSQAGRNYEKVFVGTSLIALVGAVAAGFGVMALPRSRAGLPGIAIWENAPLPKLPDIFCGIYVRGGADVEEREQLADAIAAAVSPQAAADGFARSQHTTAA
ncbi:MAG: LysR family transcriptional regulator [Xanthobacteraceae bacterium]|nr:LysR family transcriptional regulator [Xanthobacteraceae bacterium]